MLLHQPVASAINPTTWSVSKTVIIVITSHSRVVHSSHFLVIFYLIFDISLPKTENDPKMKPKMSATVNDPSIDGLNNKDESTNSVPKNPEKKKERVVCT